jgi:AraC family transcriptional regulator of adaptative response/methylated-DNA-[protein]-cysteine methyltransferase
MDPTSTPPELVTRLREVVENDPTGRITDKELARLGIDASTARRQFRRYLGMTFQAYQRARRMGLALRDVRDGRDVLSTGLDHGYESPSAFREGFAKLFGVPPRDANRAHCLLAKWIETPLGTMLALADDEGLHVLDFIDRKGLERKILMLRKSLNRVIVPGEHMHLNAITEQLRAYFSKESFKFVVPLVPLGSPWQRQVWDYLLTIAPGQTKSYAQMADELNKPTAQRAVGNANGLNYLAIVIPCHRVIRSDGTLCGYGGGLWRKQWLLDHERAESPAEPFVLKA